MASTITSDTRAKKAETYRKIGARYLTNGKFTPPSKGYTFHHPYSRDLYESLPPSALPSRLSLSVDVVTSVLQRVTLSSAPVTLAGKMLQKSLGESFSDVRICSAPPTSAESLTPFENLPFPVRTLGVEVRYPPSLGWDCSCAVLTRAAVDGVMGGELVNIKEVERGRLLCLTLVFRHPSGEIPAHVWVARRAMKATGTGVSTPHIGVAGGAYFSLLSPFLAAIGVHLNYAGEASLKLEVGGDPLLVPVSFESLSEHALSLRGSRGGVLLAAGLSKANLGGRDTWTGPGTWKGILCHVSQALRLIGLKDTEVNFGHRSPAEILWWGDRVSTEEVTDQYIQKTVVFLKAVTSDLTAMAKDQLTRGPKKTWGEYLDGRQAVNSSTQECIAEFLEVFPPAVVSYLTRSDEMDLGRTDKMGDRAMERVSSALAAASSRQTPPKLARLKEMVN
jgi:hypothetical protein